MPRKWRSYAATALTIAVGSCSTIQDKTVSPEAVLLGAAYGRIRVQRVGGHAIDVFKTGQVRVVDPGFTGSSAAEVVTRGSAVCLNASVSVTDTLTGGETLEKIEECVTLSPQQMKCFHDDECGQAVD